MMLRSCREVGCESGQLTSSKNEHRAPQSMLLQAARFDLESGQEPLISDWRGLTPRLQPPVRRFLVAKATHRGAHSVAAYPAVMTAHTSMSNVGAASRWQCKAGAPRPVSQPAVPSGLSGAPALPAFCGLRPCVHSTTVRSSGAANRHACSVVSYVVH